MASVILTVKKCTIHIQNVVDSILKCFHKEFTIALKMQSTSTK